MRLTRLVAGPVEELIYIEGPHHYEPATDADGKWEITLFGGPVRTVPQNYRLSDMEYTLEIMEGRTRTEPKNCLTKLRRVFEPNEMTEDIVFRELDLAQWLAGKNVTPPTPPQPPTTVTVPRGQQSDPNAQGDSNGQVASSALVRIAEAATQYGRWRDPNGIAPLVNALSAEALDQVIPPAEISSRGPRLRPSSSTGTARRNGRYRRCTRAGHSILVACTCAVVSGPWARSALNMR